LLCNRRDIPMTYKFAAIQPLASLEPLFAKLDKADYRARRILIRQYIRPAQSRFVYRYRSVLADPKEPTGIDGHSATTLRQIFLDNVLWLSSANDFNDPFDMVGKATAKATLTQRKDKFTRLVNIRAASESWKKRQKMIATLLSTSEEQLAEMMRNSIDTFRATTGICCFAGSARDILMWSHYASSHTGVCFQFERSRDFRTLSRAVTVDYVEDLPEVNWIINFEDGCKRMLLSKSKQWSYENENRIILEGQAHSHLRIAPEALRSVILGCNASKRLHHFVDTLVAKRALTGLPPVGVYAARRHPSRYALTIHQS